VDRAVEVVVVCLLGLPTSWYLAKQMSGIKSEENSEKSTVNG